MVVPQLFPSKGKTCALIIVLTCSFVFFLSGAPFAAAEIDKTRIYYGNPNNFQKPGEIKYAQVISVTDEWQQIKKEKIDSSDARYWILLKSINKKFQLACKKIDAKFGYDIIGEIGAIAIDKPVDNITAEMVKELSPKKKN